MNGRGKEMKKKGNKTTKVIDFFDASALKEFGNYSLKQLNNIIIKSQEKEWLDIFHKLRGGKEFEKEPENLEQYLASQKPILTLEAYKEGWKLMRRLIRIIEGGYGNIKTIKSIMSRNNSS